MNEQRNENSYKDFWSKELPQEVIKNFFNFFVLLSLSWLILPFLSPRLFTGSIETKDFSFNREQDSDCKTGYTDKFSDYKYDEINIPNVTQTDRNLIIKTKKTFQGKLYLWCEINVKYKIKDITFVFKKSDIKFPPGSNTNFILFLINKDDFIENMNDTGNDEKRRKNCRNNNEDGNINQMYHICGSDIEDNENLLWKYVYTLDENDPESDLRQNELKENRYKIRESQLNDISDKFIIGIRISDPWKNQSIDIETESNPRSQIIIRRKGIIDSPPPSN